MPDSPSKNLFESLRDTKYLGRFFDVYPLKFDKINPLQQVVPCFPLETTLFSQTQGVRPFFGPYILNIVSITGPYVKNTDPPEWDQTEVDECIELLKKAYKYFSLYELHIFIDKDAPAVQNEDNEDAMVVTKDKLDVLKTQLDGYGIHYWGELASADMAARVDTILKEFYDKVKEL